ncbi:MAG: aldehyde dehydrogenase family protein, partial [Pseudomonadota bacterium]
MSDNYQKFYINGAWVAPEAGSTTFDVIHPGNEEAVATIAMGTSADVDKAVAAAKDAFKTFGQSSVEDRVDLLERILKAYEAREEEFVRMMPHEMGTTLSFSREVHQPVGVGHLEAAIEALKA